MVPPRVDEIFDVVLPINADQVSIAAIASSTGTAMLPIRVARCRIRRSSGEDPPASLFMGAPAAAKVERAALHPTRAASRLDALVWCA
jgi:hypothetical protein